MRNKYYTSYINHCLRYYARYDGNAFKSESDVKNWDACRKVMEELPDTDRNLILDVYSRRDTLSDNVYEVSLLYGINQNYLWRKLSEVQASIAKERGLV